MMGGYLLGHSNRFTEYATPQGFSPSAEGEEGSALPTRKFFKKKLD